MSNEFYLITAFLNETALINYAMELRIHFLK